MGREMARSDVRALLGQLVDVVVQRGRDHSSQRAVREIWYRDAGSGAGTTR